MTLTEKYHNKIQQIITEIVAGEQERIQKAAAILADAIIADRLVHVFGAGGHSAIAAMEIFYRAGGLVQVNPIFPPGMNTTNGSLRLTGIEFIIFIQCLERKQEISDDKQGNRS